MHYMQSHIRPPAARPRATGPVLLRAIEMCQEHYWKLNDWERGFVDSLAAQLVLEGATERQLRCLARVLNELAR